MSKPTQSCNSPELLAALKVTVALLASASESGSLYGRHDVDWKYLRDGVRDVINQAEGRVQK
jgi:hypothetical protein